MHAFANGLFKTQQARDHASYETTEWLLHFYDYCEKYSTQINDNDTSMADVDKFLNGNNDLLNRSTYKQHVYVAKLALC